MLPSILVPLDVNEDEWGLHLRNPFVSVSFGFSSDSMLSLCAVVFDSIWKKINYVSAYMVYFTYDFTNVMCNVIYIFFF